MSADITDRELNLLHQIALSCEDIRVDFMATAAMDGNEKEREECVKEMLNLAVIIHQDEPTLITGDSDKVVYGFGIPIKGRDGSWVNFKTYADFISRHNPTLNKLFKQKGWL